MVVEVTPGPGACARVALVTQRPDTSESIRFAMA